MTGNCTCKHISESISGLCFLKRAGYLAVAVNQTIGHGEQYLEARPLGFSEEEGRKWKDSKLLPEQNSPSMSLGGIRTQCL